MDNNQIIASIENFKNLTALIVGDVMIDAYYWGKVNRISPEAPVPIVDVTEKDNRLGGAANVALNIMTLGATPIICSVIGKDEKSKLFNELLEKRKFSKEGILYSENRKTTVKTRIISQGHHLLRVDEEDTNDLDKNLEKEFINNVYSVIESTKIDVIILEDYNKGVLTENVISKIIEIANKKGIPTTVDPKKKNFFAYKNCTLFKPNLKELKEGLKIEFDSYQEKELQRAINLLHEKITPQISFVTLSEQGVIVNGNNISRIIPAHKRKILDVSGAGDTVISVASLALATGMLPKRIAEIANLAGGMVCEKVGVVPLTNEELRFEVKNKIV